MLGKVGIPAVLQKELEISAGFSTRLLDVLETASLAGRMSVGIDDVD